MNININKVKKAIKLRPNWAEGWAGLGTLYTRNSLHNVVGRFGAPFLQLDTK